MSASKVLPGAGKRKPPNAGRGRVKGVPNKATADVRAAIALLAEQNVERCQAWLDAIAGEDAGKAFDLFLRMLEYHIPKLARSEHTGEGGGPIWVASRNSHDDKI